MKTVFFGTPAWAVPSLEALAASPHRPGLVVTQPAKRRARGEAASPSPIGEASARLGLAFIEPPSVRDPAILERLSGEGAALFVVVAYGEILPRAVLEAAPHGCVNVHFSLLPRYRGAAPVQWAIANGEQETGVTTMRIVPKLDAGPIYLQEATGIGPEERAPHLGARLAAAGARLLLKTVEGIEDGTIAAQEQDASAATHARALTAADGSVDWAAPAAVIARRIRGFDPWPGQVALASKGRIKLLEGRPGPGVEGTGTVVLAEEGGRSATASREGTGAGRGRAPGGERMVPRTEQGSTPGGARLEPDVDPTSTPGGERAEPHVDPSNTPGLVLGAARGACLIRCGQGTVLEMLSLRAEGKRAIAGDDALRGRLLVEGEVLHGIPIART